jgi:hypothetical protein
MNYITVKMIIKMRSLLSDTEEVANIALKKRGTEKREIRFF